MHIYAIFLLNILNYEHKKKEVEINQLLLPLYKLLYLSTIFDLIVDMSKLAILSIMSFIANLIFFIKLYNLIINKMINGCFITILSTP